MSGEIKGRSFADFAADTGKSGEAAIDAWNDEALLVRQAIAKQIGLGSVEELHTMGPAAIQERLDAQP